MKKITFVAVFFALCSAGFSQKTKKARLATTELNTVYLESGSIENGTYMGEPSLVFKSNGFFKPTDKALGTVVSGSNCKPNGYQDSKGMVYIFEGGQIPPSMQDPAVALAAFTSATWNETSAYELPMDALVCEKKPIFTFRPAGKMPRMEAVVSGIKIYRIKNEEIVEDYTQLMDYHRTANRTLSEAVDLATVLNIRSTDYNLTSSRAGLVLTNGKIDREKSTETPAQTMDKIIFTPKNTALQKYQLRVFLIKKMTPEMDSFYEIRNNRKVLKEGMDENLFNYIKQNYLRSFRLDMIKNYDCNPCLKLQNSGLKSQLKTLKIMDDGNPPLPMIDG